MIDNIISYSINNKLIIGISTFGLICWGIYSFRQLPIDAVPDITNNQVQVISLAPKLAAQEVEQFITYPIETSIQLIPDVIEIRSISRFGLSVVTVVFEDDVDVYLARQQVTERITEAENQIPQGLTSPKLGPITTGLGEIYQYVVHTKPGYEDKYSAMDLRTIQDWIIRRQLAGTPGVADIGAWGGFVKQYEISLNPARLNNLNVSISEILEVLEQNNENTGGAYIEKGSNAYVVRGIGLVKDLESIEKIVVKTIDGVPLLIRDVAKVQFGYATRYGAVTRNGEGEVVGGVAMMLKGENTAQVVKNVKAKIVEIQKTLPEGVVIEPFVDRTKLVNRAIGTVSKNLTEGVLIVIFILVILLGNIRAGLLVASVIPLSMLFAVSMMHLFGVSANLMSMGAIDFGLIVDGAVIIVESAVHRITQTDGTKSNGARLNNSQMDTVVLESAKKMMNSATFGQVIILVVYIPILALVGIEGKMFRPMAQTVSFAVLGALILCLTYVPMMSALVLRDKRVFTFSELAMRFLQNAYRPVINFALHRMISVLVMAIGLLAISLYTFSNIGGEFIPTLEEGDFAIETSLMQGSSLTQSVQTFSKAERILVNRFPEVEQVVSRIGTGEVPSDPMPIENGDIMVILKDKSEWTSALTTEGLSEKMEETLAEIPGVRFEITQPIQMRFNELMTGIRQDVAVKIYGEDLGILAEKADQVSRLIRSVNGITDPYVEKVEGLPQITVEYDRNKLAQYGIKVSNVNNILKTAFAGQSAGVVYEGEKRFDLVVRLEEAHRQDMDDIQSLFVPLPSGRQVPMGQIATIKYAEGPAQISRDNAQRRIYVGFNVRGRDVQSVIREIQTILDEKLQLPPGYYITYGGQFENFQAAKERLLIALPAALLLIFIMLFFTFRSVKQALLIYSAIPLSAIGGIFALFLRGMPFSISAGIGFIALFGVAVLNGIVLISYFNQLKKEGMKNIKQRVLEGTKVRFRPVVLTASVAALGFLPMAISTSAGAEVQKPLATVVIGGLISATLLTLVVLPVLYIMSSGKAKNSNEKKSSSSLGGLSLSVLMFAMVICFPSSQLKAQTGKIRKLTLSEAIQEAVTNNQSVKVAAYQVDRQQALKKSSVDIGQTNFSLEYGQTNSIAKNDNVINISQDFAFPTLYINQAELAQSQVKSSERQLEVSKNELIRKVKMTWYQLSLSLAKRDLLQYQDSVYTNFSKAAALRYNTGESSLLEKATADARLMELKVHFQQTERDILIQQKQLQTLLNTNEIVTVAGMPIENRKIILPVDTAVVSQNPEIKLLQQELLVRGNITNVQRSQMLPGFTIGYFNQSFIGPGVDGNGDEVNFTSSDRFTGIHAGISIPVWFRPQQGRIQAAKINQQIAEANLKYYRDNIESRFQVALQRYHQNKGMLDYFEQQGLPQAELILQNASTSYRAGQIGYFEYTQHLDRALRIRFDYLDTLGLFNQSIIEIEFLGGDN